jgi:RNA polymerase sigma factor (sigma-70 family)
MATLIKKDLSKLFCTVLREFKPDGVTPIWKVNQTLQSRLEQLLEKQPYLDTEDECTIHLVDIYRHQERMNPKTKLAESFLCYYLQQIAYQAAHKTYNSTSVSGMKTERSTYKKDELFAIASAKIPKIIQNFNPQSIGEFTAGFGSRLGGYAYQVFRNAIRAAISLQQVDRLSDWGLIVHGISSSYLTKALQEQEFTQLEIDSHRLMLQSFQQIHRKTGNTDRPTVEIECKRSRRLTAPNDEQIQLTIGCYNLLRQDRPQYRYLPPLAESSGDLVVECLLQCAHAVRAARQEPQLVSLNKFLGQEDDTELGEMIPDLHTPSPLVAIEQDEFLTVLGDLAVELSPQWQRAMKLVYGEGLNQSAIAVECGVDQGTVSRWQKGNRGKGGWLRTLQEKLAQYYEPHITFAAELLDPVMGTEVLEYYLELLYSDRYQF